MNNEGWRARVSDGGSGGPTLGKGGGFSTRRLVLYVSLARGTDGLLLVDDRVRTANDRRGRTGQSRDKEDAARVKLIRPVNNGL